VPDLASMYPAFILLMRARLDAGIDAPKWQTRITQYFHSGAAPSGTGLSVPEGPGVTVADAVMLNWPAWKHLPSNSHQRPPSTKTLRTYFDAIADPVSILVHM